jgi:hypothetical protein
MVFRVRNPHAGIIESLGKEQIIDIHSKGTGLYFLRMKKDLSGILEQRRMGRDHWVLFRKSIPKVLRKGHYYTWFE